MLLHRVLVAVGTFALLTACVPTAPEPQRIPTRAATLETTTAASRRGLTERPIEPVPPSAPVRAARSEPSATADDRMSPPDATFAVSLRLPVAADLGPNYFELIVDSSKQMPGKRREGPTNTDLVAFGFSERAKLRDERIERDGPLAAVARRTVHPTAESAARFGAEISAAARRRLPATGGTALPLGLKAALNGSRPSSHDLAPGVSATHSRHAGWFVAFDGSSTKTVVEQWTIVGDRTVLTVALVWSGQVHHGWGQSLVRRLVQSGSRQAASHAP